MVPADTLNARRLAPQAKRAQASVLAAGIIGLTACLVSGGVIMCDDYGAPLFPGAYRAWNRYCDEAGIPLVVLDTGQAVLLKP